MAVATSTEAVQAIPCSPPTSRGYLDIHQHLWPRGFVEALRRRFEPPFLDGWNLRLPDEPDFAVTPADHDIALRAELDGQAEFVGVSLSSPLGLEYLHPDVAVPLIDVWHTEAALLPRPFGFWAAMALRAAEPEGLAKVLAAGAVGWQVPATALSEPGDVEKMGPLLAVCESAGKPVLIHPGPARPDGQARARPPWWPAVVDYPAQLGAAWWSWYEAGRSQFPDLRVCFAAGAGLAPVHHERMTARGGGRLRLDPLTFVETSSYGPRAVDALIRVLGIDVIVNGTDRPYAGPTDFALGDAAHHAVRVTNPTRLLEGGRP